MTQTKLVSQTKKDWVTIHHDNGDVYFGESKGDKACGWAVYTYRNGDVYEGEWANGGRHGKGSMRYANGDRYDGNFKRDLEDGWGIYKWACGDKYCGRWKKGNRHGRGRMAWFGDDVYDGEWKDDQKHGEGTYHFVCEDLVEYKQGLRRYTGWWKKDEKCGYGSCKYGNGDQYKGMWRGNMCHGQGTYTFGEDGTTIEGEFKDNYLHGKCVQTFVNGDVYDGQWKKGKKHGAGTVTKANGVVYQQVYKCNRLTISEITAGSCNDETEINVKKRCNDGPNDETPTKKRRNKLKRRGHPSPFSLFVVDFNSRRRASGKKGEFKERGSAMKAAAVEWRSMSSEEKKTYETRLEEWRAKKMVVTPERGDGTGGGEDGDDSGDAEDLVGRVRDGRQVKMAAEEGERASSSFDRSLSHNKHGEFLASPPPKRLIPMVEAKTGVGGTKMVPMYEVGMRVRYRNARGIQPAEILDVQMDHLMEPYYSIRLADGREKQAHNSHVLLEDGEEEDEQEVGRNGEEESKEDAGEMFSRAEEEVVHQGGGEEEANGYPADPLAERVQSPQQLQQPPKASLDQTDNSVVDINTEEVGENEPVDGPGKRFIGGTAGGTKERANSNSKGSAGNVSVRHPAQQQQPAQTPQEQNELPRGEADNPPAAIKREEDGESEPPVEGPGIRTPGAASARGQSEVPETRNATAGASSDTARTSELELGALYNDIKNKLRKSKTKDEKVFYGHVKHYFSRKLRHGSLLPPSDIDRIKNLVGRFETNVKLLNDKENDYDDICVFGGFVKHIIKECEKELAIA